MNFKITNFKIIKIVLIIPALTPIQTITKIEIENLSEKPIAFHADKMNGWVLVQPKPKNIKPEDRSFIKTIETQGKGERRFYWSQDCQNYYYSQEYSSPDILTIKTIDAYDIKETLKSKKENIKALKAKNFTEIRNLIKEPEKKDLKTIASSQKSIELKVNESKSNYSIQEIKLINFSGQDIYIYLDCNYKISGIGGGYDRKTSARRLSSGVASGYNSFLLYTQKGEKVAFRWTYESNPETANWYESEYKNYENKQITSIEIKANGKYIERYEPEISGIKIHGSIIVPIISSNKDKEIKANEIIFKKRGEIIDATEQKAATR